MSFDYQPTLRGELVLLRPLIGKDFDALYLVASDPLIWQQHPVRDRYRKTVFRTFFSDALASGGTLVAVASENQRIIGSSRFHGHDEERSEVEIGWTFLARPYWGGRYNGEMKQLMLQHAFQTVSRVVFLVGSNNIRSQRAVEKIGGIRTGTRPDASGQDGYLYEITAAAFAGHSTRGTDRALSN